MTDWTRPLQLLRGSRLRLQEGGLARVLFLAIPVLAVLEPKGTVILFLVLAGLSLALGEARQRCFRFLRTPLVVLLGCLLIWYGITALWSPDVAEGLWRSLRTLIMVAAGLAVLSLVLAAGAADRAAVERALVWSGVLFPILFLVGMAGCRLRPAEALPWLSHLGTICDTPPLRVAAVQLPGLAPAFALVLWRRWGGAALAAFLGLTVVGLVINPKFAGLVALGGGGVAFAVAYLGRRAGLRILAASCTIAALVSPQATAFIAEQPAVQSAAPTLPVSWQHRITIWTVTAEQIADRPLAGYGAGFHRYLRGIEGPPITLYDEGEPITIPLRFHHPHNTFMQVWLESGAVGALLMTGAFVAFWWMLLRSGLSRVELATVAAAFVAWFVASATDFDPWETRWIAGQLTIMVVTAAAVSRNARGLDSAPAPWRSGLAERGG